MIKQFKIISAYLANIARHDFHIKLRWFTAQLVFKLYNSVLFMITKYILNG